MSRVWFTSDLHIGHDKVARERTYGWVLPRYVGAEIHAHDALLARNWDAAVAPDDVVWVAGDISSGTKTAQLRALDWLRERPGRKRALPGNHCGTHPLHRDSHKWLPIYLGQDKPDEPAPFECVQLAAKIRIPLREGHVTAMISHFPYTGDHSEVDRYPEWRLPDHGHYIIHGHTHSGWILTRGGNQEVPRINQIHVGVDAWDFRPVSLDEITSRIQKIEDGEIEPGLVWKT